jgi:hypothetical protein
MTRYNEFRYNQGGQTSRIARNSPSLEGLSRNTQTPDAGRVFPKLQRYFKPLTNNQNNYSKKKSIFEYFSELVVSHIKFISKILIVSLILLRCLLLLNTT